MNVDLKKIGLFLAPVLFVFILILPPPSALSADAWKVVAMAAFMLIWWVTEAVPIPVTAILPIILLPFFGIAGLDLKAAAAPYANPIVFLFMGGFMIAVAMERWRLHRRIALNIVKLTGTNANGIILGFMISTAAISMWISNTATTVMMLPIALSVIDLLTDNPAQLSKNKGMKNFSISMMLGIAYSANIGGTATIIGTPPTVVFAGFMEETYDYTVSFANWMLLGFPFAVVMTFLAYWVITRFLFPNRLGVFKGAQEVITSELAKLGKMQTGERRTLFVFGGTALFWMLRNQINQLVGVFLPTLQLSDTSIALMATVLLFVIPIDYKKGKYILEWKDTEKLPWGILLLFGGGLSLAGALNETGIIDMIGQQFTSTQSVGLLVMLGLTAVSLFLTEIMSNLALVVVFLPVVGGVAVGMGVDPLLMCIPVTLAASCAFMLPMSTPPNAIVFASGYLRIPQMVRAGVILNILAILLIALVAQFVVPSIFGL
jgi:sodium-dependent dicarboxylate transporter 2/3/5